MKNKRNIFLTAILLISGLLPLACIDEQGNIVSVPTINISGTDLYVPYDGAEKNIDAGSYNFTNSLTGLGACLKDTGQNVTSSSWTQASLSQIEYSKGCTINNTGSSSNITIIYDGLYMITSYIAWNAGTTGDRAARIKKDGTVIVQAYFSGAAQKRIPLVMSANCSAGAVLTFEVWHNDGGGWLTVETIRFSAARLF